VRLTGSGRIQWVAWPADEARKPVALESLVGERMAATIMAASRQALEMRWRRHVEPAANRNAGKVAHLRIA
jgi:hypothetical protein